MYVNYDALQIAINNNDQRYANYYSTYGFLVIKNILSRKEFSQCVSEYDTEYRRRTGEESAWAMLANRFGFSGKKRFGFRKIVSSILRKGMAFLPYFAEDSKYFTEMLSSDKMTVIFKYFCGENWLYLGSDGSRFATTSFPWHRDWNTKIELMKCNFYFNTFPFLGGRFLVIPGSQNFADTYARRIQKSISWPLQNKNPSGMNENNYIPKIINPRKKFSFKDFFNIQSKFDVPHTKIKIKKGDLVIFDQRLMHCVETSFPQVTRRLMTFLISKNAFDLTDDHELLEKNSRNEIMTDLLDLIVNERNHIGCPPWGAEYEVSSLATSNHYIKIEKIDNSESYNKASINTNNGIKFESIVDFDLYSKFGREYRAKFSYSNEGAADDKMAQDFSYHDVHLGINCQNIK